MAAGWCPEACCGVGLVDGIEIGWERKASRAGGTGLAWTREWVMKFNVKALAVACAILWGGAVLLIGVANLICPQYGQRFLEVLASFYPGYHATRSLVEVVLVTAYALVDGLIGGAIFGWLYNRFAKAA